MTASSLPEPWSPDDFRPIARMLQTRRGVVLPPHRLSLLQARLHARLRSRGIPSFTWFHNQVLAAAPGGSGMQLLVDLSTVNHTSFFREAPQIDAVAQHLAGRLRSDPLEPVRVWSAGCSGGQEPYSLAMVVTELVPGLSPHQLEIWASDVSWEMIHAAARATYDERILGDISPERIRRFFMRGRGRRRGYYRIVPEIRRFVTFQHFDLRSADWPVPGDFDAILCRNVALYFTEAERPALLDRLAHRLRKGGWLVVGNCEILPDRPGVLEKLGPSIFREAVRQ
jgi:chemotaxis protein methyltransferase CheR